ncbi:restriction endonuclease subunit S, partial [Salinibacterium sp.]|uniref:restriction endonuclease subunit S n=1 Tax=Salinibacterium sp. TaxID=1915057 RepID=UPI0037CB67F0
MSWPTVKLGDVVELQAGIGFPPSLQGRTHGEFPFAKVGDISSVARAGLGDLRGARNYVSREDIASLRARIVPVGSTLFAKIGEAISQNFRVLSGVACLIDNNAMAAIPQVRIDSRFLYRFLQTVDMYAIASSTAVPSLRKTDLALIPVPLPPLPEQRRIASIL